LLSRLPGGLWRLYTLPAHSGSLWRTYTRMSFDMSVKGEDFSDRPFAPSPLCEQPPPLLWEFGVIQIALERGAR